MHFQVWSQIKELNKTTMSSYTGKMEGINGKREKSTYLNFGALYVGEARA